MKDKRCVGRKGKTRSADKTQRTDMTRTTDNKQINGHLQDVDKTQNTINGPNAENERQPKTQKKELSYLYNINSFVVMAVMISMMTFAVRMVYVTDRKNWIIVHPDEVYQSIEVAHIEYFGYGFRTYEFSTYSDDEGDKNVTRYRHMELEAGLSALRSPMFPYFYVIVIKMAALLGIVANPYLIFRLSHVFITSLLPLSVHFYVTNMFHSNYAGILAAFWTASSIHLNVLGSHAFVHSFLSPFIYFTISLVANQKSREVDAAPHDTITQFNSFIDTNNNNTLCDNSNQIVNKEITNHNIRPLESEGNTEHPCASCSFHYSFETVIKHVYDHSLQMFTTRPMPRNVFGNLLAGFLAGITCYIRPDSILIHCVNSFLLLSTNTKTRKHIIFSQGPIIFIGIIMSILIGVFLDTQFYGRFTVTPLNWFAVNVIQNVSTVVFGKMNFSFYITSMYSLDVLLFGSLAVSVILYFIIILLYFYKFDPYSEKCNELRKREVSLFSLTQLFISVSSLLAIYSFHGHKEVRFSHDIIVIACVFTSLTISKAVSLIITNGETSFRRRMSLLCVLVVVSSFKFRQFLNHTSTTQWSFQHDTNTQDVNACLEFVSNRPDVRGVFLESNIFLTGGITLLHKDVPIFSRMMSGYAEFDYDSRINTSQAALITRSHSQSVNTFTRVSNYVSQTNIEGILRVILERDHYNYLVTSSRQPFLRMDFRVVFQQGNTLVLRRSEDSASKIRINTILNRLTLGANVTVLVHEGDVLFHMKRYAKAASRFQHALGLELSLSDSDVVLAYLPLYQAMKEMGHHREAKEVMKRCVNLYGKANCWKPRKMTRL